MLQAAVPVPDVATSLTPIYRWQSPIGQIGVRGLATCVVPATPAPSSSSPNSDINGCVAVKTVRRGAHVVQRRESRKSCAVWYEATLLLGKPVPQLGSSCTWREDETKGRGNLNNLVPHSALLQISQACAQVWRSKSLSVLGSRTKNPVLQRRTELKTLIFGQKPVCPRL
jgi:hypothetical protein